jgi:ankyrin repeat protein
LHSAAAGSHAAIVKLLLEHGADPNAAQDGG